MREILFRGKRTDNGDWVEGFIVSSRENTYPNGFEMINVDGINYDELDNYIPNFISYAVDPSTVCQYTGLKDKNGERIFEGDILLVDGEDGYFKLEFDEDTARFIMLGDSILVDFDNFWSYEVEIIGNVHDNPELLEK